MLDLRPARLDDPDARTLIDEVQQYYVLLYGQPDLDPMNAAEFAPPLGGFLVGFLDRAPVAMGGWSRLVGDPATAKVRRMFVRPAWRRRGLAAIVLDALEADARTAGVRRIILETGEPQADAVLFYRGRGYADVPRFGFYADKAESVHLGKSI